MASNCSSESCSGTEFEYDVGPGSIYLGPRKLQGDSMFMSRLKATGGRCRQAIAKNPKIVKRVLIFSWVLVVITIVGVSIWYAILLALIHRLSPPPQPINGLSKVLSQWSEPGSSSTPSSAWLPDFTRDIIPLRCHSHNDYWRAIPLYDALSVGCTSVEADVWLYDDNELYVGHSRKSLEKARTFSSLYIDPITTILTNQNAHTNFTNTTEWVGVFDTSPNTTLVLLVDFKTDGHDLFPVVEQQLAALREKGWLTYFNGTTLVPGPVTVVGSGNTQFSDVLLNDTYRDIFFDAPLQSLSPEYTTENSYYASVSLKNAVGTIWFDKFSSKQKDTVKKQIQDAEKRGLVSRYWDTPSWPVGWRVSIWEYLVGEGVGILNVDELQEAGRWRWGSCVVMGIVLC